MTETRKLVMACATVFEEIEGSTALVKKIVNGPWDDDFIVMQPGQVIPGC